MRPFALLITHLRRNAVAYVALVAALGTGTAYAAGKITGKDIARNAVAAKHIKNGQVKRAELAAGAVNGGRVADGSLSGADLAADSITGAQIDESTLRGLAAAPPSPPVEPEPVDLSGLTEAVASGFIAGPGPLTTGDRCNSVGTTVEGARLNDHLVISPITLYEDVVFTGTVSPDFVSYQACYTGDSSINIGGDVRFLLLRVR